MKSGRGAAPPRSAHGVRADAQPRWRPCCGACTANAAFRTARARAARPAPSASQHHGSPLPTIDLPRTASSNILPNITLESGSTGSVKPSSGLQAEVAADDLLHDLGGAAENRLDAAEPPEPSLAPESIGLALRRSRPGCIWSARAAAFAWRELGRDHAPGDRLAAPQLPEPRRGPDHHAEPAAPDIPAIDTDVDPGSSSRHSCHRSSRCTIPATAARCGRAPASRRAAIRTSAGVSTLTTPA